MCHERNSWFLSYIRRFQVDCKNVIKIVQVAVRVCCHLCIWLFHILHSRVVFRILLDIYMCAFNKRWQVEGRQDRCFIQIFILFLEETLIKKITKTNSRGISVVCIICCETTVVACRVIQKHSIIMFFMAAVFNVTTADMNGGFFKKSTLHSVLFTWN